MRRLAIAAALAALMPAAGGAVPSSTITSMGKPKLSATAWTLRYDNAIETTRSPYLLVPIRATCVLERSSPGSDLWVTDSNVLRVTAGGRPAPLAVLCSDVSTGTVGWPDTATLDVKKNIRIAVQISPSLGIDPDECDGICRVVRRDTTLRMPLRAKYGPQSFPLGRLEIKISNYRPETARRVWEGTDEFVNFCINSSATVMSSGGRLYCTYYYPASARATARIVK